jgi:hypothetical protein
MDSCFDSVKIARPLSWKVCVLVVAVALAMDLLLIRSPLVGIEAVGVLAVAALFWNHKAGLAVVIFACGLLMYSPFETGALSRLYPGDVAIGLFLILWVVRCRSRRRLFQPDLINAPLFGLAIVMVLSMVWARLFPDPSVAYSFPHSDVSWTTTQIAQLGLLLAIICMPFAVAATIRNWKDIETVIVAMGTVTALGALLTILALVFGFGSSYTILGFRRAYWQQPWHSSVQPLSWVVLPFLYSGVLFGRRSLSAYRLICLLFALCLLGAALSFSREAWAISAFELGLVSALWLRRSAAKVFAFAAIAFLLLAVLVPGVSAIMRFYNPNDVYGLERIYYYAAGLQLFATHPFLGVGLGNGQFFVRTYTEVDAPSHDQFITLAMETGAAGVLMFLWFLVRLLGIRKKFNLRKGRFRDPHYWVKAAGSVFLLAWVIQCFFGEAFFVTAAYGGGTGVVTAVILAWISLGVVFAVCNLSQTASPAKIENALVPNR